MLTLTQKIMIGALLFIGALLASRLFMKSNSNEYDRLYSKVLTSDEYKVKGRFEE